MGKNKKPSVQAPEIYNFPGQEESILDFRNLGGRLTSFDFSGELSPLQQAIELDPDITRLALKQAQGQLEPQQARQRQNTVNELANLGALESSTTANAFALSDNELNQQYQSIVAGAGLEDRSRALQNRLGLFGTGLNVTESALGFGAGEQASRNQLLQQQFENQLAVQQLSQSNRGGFAGGLTGGIGGAALGAALAPFTGGLSLLAVGGLGAAGAAAGAMGPSGTGGTILKSGTTLAGAGALKGGFGGVRPGSAAGALSGGVNDTELQKILNQIRFN